MNTAETKTDRTVSLLRKRGYRLTSVRRTVLELLGERPVPLSVPDIQAALGRRRLRPNKTTLYREMRTLERAGLIDPVHLGDRTTRYELRRDDHHHHLVCLRCGAVADVGVEDDCLADTMDRTIERRSRFRVLRHSLEFFGLCSHCREN